MEKYKKIWAEIIKHQRILLHLHPGPDGDCVGSTLSMYQALTALGKNVTLISGDSTTTANLLTLPGSEHITPASFFDVDLNDFDLFIILDTSSRNQISKRGEVTFPSHLVTICLDHHTGNDISADFSLINPKISSTSEIIYRLFNANKIGITSEMAACLMVGFFTDTGGFRYPPTNYKTFQAAARLTKINPNFSQYIFNVENNDRPSRLAVTGLLLRNIKTYFSGKVALATISQKEMQKYNIDREAVANLDVPNMIKAVVGWDIGGTLIEGVDGFVKMSLRTRDPKKYDLGNIARITGFGGGHMAAAGASFPYSLAKSTKYLLSVIQKVHPQLGNP